MKPKTLLELIKLITAVSAGVMIYVMHGQTGIRFVVGVALLALSALIGGIAMGVSWK